MKYGLVAAGHEKTAWAACQILKDGGNAFDAAVAAYFASFITEPCMSSAGGGGFANIYTKEKSPVFLDFFCQTPRSKKVDQPLDFVPMVVDFGETSETFHLGIASIATPGMIAGIYHIHDHFCTIPMKHLLEPALELARNGVVMNGFQVFDIKVLKPIMVREDESRNIFYPNDTSLQVGDVLRMPQMADYLEYLVKEGREEFYQGEFAKQLIQTCQERGGYLKHDDLKNYQVLERKPLSIPYMGRRVLTNPMPSMGGTILGLMLRKMSTAFRDRYDVGSPRHVSTLQAIIGEVLQYEKRPEALFSKWGSTTHFNIVDRHGNAFNTTVSNGEGCGHMVKGTNIMMNNMLGEASLLPDGFHNWPEDTRLSSMMSPTMVTSMDGSFEMAIGTGGGSRIPSMIFQVLHYLIDHGFTVQDAVDASRLHNEYGELNLEPDFVGKHTEKEGLHVKNWDESAMFFGGVHTIVKQKDGFYAASDDRREGFVMEV